jgi:hypothetical protein
MTYVDTPSHLACRTLKSRVIHAVVCLRGGPQWHDESRRAIKKHSYRPLKHREKIVEAQKQGHALHKQCKRPNSEIEKKVVYGQSRLESPLYPAQGYVLPGN